MDKLKDLLIKFESVFQYGKFKSLKELGDEIEDMDSKVESKDRIDFDKIIEKYLGHIFGLNSDLTISEAIQKLKPTDAKSLYDALLDLHYED